MQKLPSNTGGFTLIELSIVLVIIGLIVGGILVGQDLIRAAEIRATIGQIEKFNTEVNTFYQKYGGLPGDLTFDRANNFGFFTFTGDCGIGCIQGDGLIEAFPGEQSVFWRHLSDASLIDGAYGSVGAAAMDGHGIYLHNLQGGDLALGFPAAKLTGGYYFIVQSDSSFNYFGLYSISYADADDLCYTTGNNGLTPLDAANIDTKIDDGFPNTGRVKVVRPAISCGIFSSPDFGSSWNNTSTPGNCMMGGSSATDSADLYNTQNGGDISSCNLTFQFQ